MRKTKFLALALAVAVMMLGAGYAYWTAAVTVTSNVNTGHVNAYLTGGKVTYYQDLNGTVDNTVTHLGVNSEVAVTDAAKHNATVTLQNLYPGEKIHVVVPFVNDSTIPVKISSAPTFSAVTDTNGKTVSQFIKPAVTVYPTGLIAAGAGGNIEFDVVVDSNASGLSTMDAGAQFTMTANFDQFNK
jgi:hypothetical protein